MLSILTLLVTPTEALAAIKSLGGQTGKSQSFQNDANLTISSSNNVHSILWQGLLPLSRGGTGASSFTDGSIPFIHSGVFSQDNSNLFWDNTNKRLGIGTSSPSVALEVNGSFKATNLNTSADSTIHGIAVGRGAAGDGSSTAIGAGALGSNLSANNNTAIGQSALGSSSNSGEQNTAVGSLTLSESNSTGSYNSAYGYSAMRYNTTGIRNTALGMHALSNNTTGSDNVVVGFGSYGGSTGSGNVAIGYRTFAFGSGGSNVTIGAEAALHQADGLTALTANNSIYIGASTRGLNNNDNNSIVLGYGATGAGANTTVIGNSSMRDVYFGSSNAVASAHATKIYLGSASIPGCIIIGDSDGSGVTYITVNDGAINASITPPSACQ